MDNAYEAASLSEEKKLGIRINFQDSYLNIFICNTMASLVMEKNSELKTSKKIKLLMILQKNMRKFTEKYEGIIEYSENERFLVCDILIAVDTKHVL